MCRWLCVQCLCTCVQFHILFFCSREKHPSIFESGFHPGTWNRGFLTWAGNSLGVCFSRTANTSRRHYAQLACLFRFFLFLIAHMWGCAHDFRHPWRPEERIGSPRAEGKGACEFPGMDVGKQTHVLWQEDYALSTIKTSSLCLCWLLM